jgi:glycolate oxidase
LALTRAFVDLLRQRLGPEHVLQDAETLAAHAADAFGVGHLPQVVVRPGDTADVAAVSTLCNEHRVPLVVRGAGTGYTGGAVPVAGGVVLSVERLNRILAIDTDNLLAVVQPAVITAVLQREVERVGLFYPPDPASLDQCSIGGNVAECAGGPRAFKYGTTKRYVLALEAVLPTGEVVRTGSKAVKNVVGYDLTQLLVGSEGTLAIVTEATLRVVPKPPARAALSAFFSDIRRAVAGVTAVIRAVIPARCGRSPTARARGHARRGARRGDGASRRERPAESAVDRHGRAPAPAAGRRVAARAVRPRVLWLDRNRRT